MTRALKLAVATAPREVFFAARLHFIYTILESTMQYLVELLYTAPKQRFVFYSVVLRNMDFTLFSLFQELHRFYLKLENHSPFSTSVSRK